MNLYDILVKYGKGKGEDVMWRSTKAISDFLLPMKEVHKEKYWALMREVYGIMSGGHYNEEFADYDVADMKPIGEYWSRKQIEDATKSMSFPAGVTLCDKYVAFNAFANDLKGTLTDEEILKTAYVFWFADKDWEGSDKIWRYMSCRHKKTYEK